MKYQALLSTLILALMTGCGGGGSDSSSTASSTASVSSNDVALIATAVKNGSVAGLSTAQREPLLQQALALAKRYQQQQNAALGDIYGTANLDLTLNIGKNSNQIGIGLSTIASPLISSDEGRGMAAIAQYGKGRGLAYGADVLSWMAAQSAENQHYPLFNRAFNWVLTGKAAGPLPATVKFATAGYDAKTVTKLLSRMGAASTSCDLAVDSCGQDADVLIYGGAVKDDAALLSQVRHYLSSGKAVIYMHPNWGDSAGGRKVLQGLGMSLGGYGGNYFASTAGTSVGNSRTLSDVLKAGDKMSPLVQAISQMSSSSLSLDLSKDSASTDAITALHNELATQQSAGVDIFAEPVSDLHQLLVLWADLYRPDIVYGKINRETQPAEFLRTYATDSWLVFNRASTTVAKAGQGDFMPVAAQSLPVSSSAETIEVTIAQTDGTTAIGRAAVPGQPLYIEVSGGNGKLAVQTNYLRTWGNPLVDAVSEGYKRPRRPHSFSIPLKTSGETVFVTSSGGPLYLNYSGATPGQSVTLKIRGAAKYAHFDFTKPQSDAEVNEAVAALKRKDFGWQTAKFTGGEIQQTTAYAIEAMGSLDPKVYIVDQIKGMLFDSNHIANGYSNMPMSSNVATLCTSVGWTCDGLVHRAPGVQHFVGWIAACGYLCSGNPSDGYAGISGTGWGHAHELGHNTVQRVMHIELNGKGCLVECDNNILASAHMMRQYALIGLDNGHITDHPALYQYIVENRKSGKTGEAQRADMEARLWGGESQDPMRAVHFQLAFLFSKYRAKEAVPSMQASMDYFTLLTKADRLVSKEWAAGNKYGMSRYANNTISNHELIYVLSSKIIGQDVRKIFAMYGLPLSQTALDSVADLQLPVATEQFYALAQKKFNQVSTGKWLDLSTTSPAYPL
ncbi:ImpA family metalloprotease [Iodobacter sp. CM08]|uniref:ImpA family metalloprotease n=1 Tax=Iodobacter sp. CM08 TaxID=3085902 RepID=UPI002981F308|nr:ImpA family metalloprotease [Iodobacter sp. CM08]MDW5417874.1 ImpA family metalloprotease [Iodobacter sp. CM08]